MYKIRGGHELSITVNEWIEIFKHFDKIGLERLIKFARAVNRSSGYDLNGTINQFRNQQSRLWQLMNNYGNIIDYLIGHEIDIAGKGYALEDRDCLSDFFYQIKAEKMTFIDCLNSVEELKRRGIMQVVKREISNNDKKISMCVSSNRGAIVRCFSNMPIKAEKIASTDDYWSYDIKLNPHFSWYIRSVDDLDNNQKIRFMELDRFDLDFNKIPTKEEMDDIKFHPETQKGYQIIKK